MRAEFTTTVRDLSLESARACFHKAVWFSRLAKLMRGAARVRCYCEKVRYVEQAIRIAPRLVRVDDFELRAGALVGLTLQTSGRLHVPLRYFADDTREWILRRILDLAVPSQGRAA